MITASPRDGQPDPGVKAVPSIAPGPGPRDASADLQRHRDRGAGPTVAPPGGYPQTAGTNPDAPAHAQVSETMPAGPDGWW